MTGRVVVVGSLNVDLVARVERLPVAGETVSGADLVRTPGGKGLNQAVAAARAGASVALVGAVGDDEHGRWLRSLAAAEGIDVSQVTTVEVPTGTALITVASGGANTIVVAPGANRWAPSSDDVVLTEADVVLCQAEVPQGVVTAACRAARAVGAATIVNLAPFRPPEPGQWELIDVPVVNETELAALLAASGVDVAPPGEADDAGRARRLAERAARALLAARPGPTALVVTLGGAGAVAVPEDGPALVAEAPTVAAVDTVGAGDCLTGWLAAGLAFGLALGPALEQAVMAASIAVQRPGAAVAMPTAEQVSTAAGRSWAVGPDR